MDLYQQQSHLTEGREIVADEAYLTESMMEPTGKVVAGYQAAHAQLPGQAQRRRGRGLVEFIKSLRSDRTVQAVGGDDNEPADHHRRRAPAGAVFPEESYLNDERRIRSWLLTLDHKRIAIMYLVGSLIGLFLGGVFAMVLRLELLTPGPTIIEARTPTTGCSPCTA